MTDFIAHIVRQGNRYRVALTPVSQGGASPIVATAWAEQDRRIFEAATHQEADAFIGQLSDKFWSVSPPASIKPKSQKHSAKSQRSTR